MNGNEEKNQGNSFIKIKKFLKTTPILACPDFRQSFVLETNASDTAVGAVLTWTRDGQQNSIH